MEKKHMPATNNLDHRRQCPATYQFNSNDHLVPELCRDPPQQPHCADLVLGSHLVHHSLANQERRPQHPILHLGRMLRHSLRHLLPNTFLRCYLRMCPLNPQLFSGERNFPNQRSIGERDGKRHVQKPEKKDHTFSIFFSLSARKASSQPGPLARYLKVCQGFPTAHRHE